MRARTIVILERLERAHWFSRVGVHDTDEAIVLSSWNEAIEHCSTLEWENFCLDAVNDYREQLRERFHERSQKWNDVVADVRPPVYAIVRRKVELVSCRNDLPKVFEDTVRWDILNLCIEMEHADLCPPGFYAKQTEWYLKGHFPCGWHESVSEYPRGKPIIY